MIKDERRQVKVLIDKGVLKTFRAIFLHLPVNVIAQELKITEDEMSKIINAPQKYPFVIFFKIGGILNVSEWNMLQLIYTQAMREQKTELEKHFAEVLMRRTARLMKKQRRKATRKKSATK